MKRRNMFVAAALIGVLALGAMAAAGKLGGRKKDGLKAVAVARGSLVDKALAVGTIEPRVEVSVKSILAGVVRQRFAAVRSEEHTSELQSQSNLVCRLL